MRGTRVFVFALCCRLWHMFGILFHGTTILILDFHMMMLAFHLYDGDFILYEAKNCVIKI